MHKSANCEKTDNSENTVQLVFRLHKPVIFQVTSYTNAKEDHAVQHRSFNLERLTGSLMTGHVILTQKYQMTLND